MLPRTLALQSRLSMLPCTLALQSRPSMLPDLFPILLGAPRLAREQIVS